jgi:hypothetical protein
MGGNFQWNSIPPQYADVLSFSLGGRYQKTMPAVANNMKCLGTYIVRAGNKLEINTGCYTTPEKVFISELTPGTLILDQPGIEGVTRYKFTAIK